MKIPIPQKVRKEPRDEFREFAEITAIMRHPHGGQDPGALTNGREPGLDPETRERMDKEFSDDE